jgi:hypothetical protein
MTEVVAARRSIPVLEKQRGGLAGRERRATLEEKRNGAGPTG